MGLCSSQGARSQWFSEALRRSGATAPLTGDKRKGPSLVCVHTGKAERAPSLRTWERNEMSPVVSSKVNQANTGRLYAVHTRHGVNQILPPLERDRTRRQTQVHRKHTYTQRGEHLLPQKPKFVSAPRARQAEGPMNKPLGHASGLFKVPSPFQKRAEDILLSGRGVGGQERTRESA